MKYVYLLRNERSQYKVGVATNVRSRVRTIQTSNPDKIDIVASKLSEDAYALEARLHQFLLQHRTGGGQEWFTLNDQEALDIAVLMNEEAIPEILSKHLTLESLLRDVSFKYKEILNGLASIPVTQAALTREVEPTADEVAAVNVAPESSPQAKWEDALSSAMEVFQKEGRVSASLLQRKLNMGYAKAARVVDALEEQGKVGAFNGSRARTLLP